jgi:inward rectifier potassium channel
VITGHWNGAEVVVEDTFRTMDKGGYHQRKVSDLGQTRVFGHSSGGVVSVGLRKRPLADLYHRLVTGPWTRLCLVYAVVFFGAEALFEAAHFALGEGAPVARGSVIRALVALARGAEFDAVRADLDPRAMLSGLLVGVEAFFRWLEVVIGAGIVLAKFSLLRARVLWSEVAVVAPHPDGRALLFRMANERTGHVVDAKVSAMLVRNELDEDGGPVRRAHDLPLTRGGTALFSHAWTAVHVVDRESPLAGESAESLAGSDAEVIVTLTGFDEGLTRTIHARHVWPAAKIVWNARFREIVKVLPGGTREVDYGRFHDVVPVEDAKPERTPRRARGA